MINLSLFRIVFMRMRRRHLGTIFIYYCPPEEKKNTQMTSHLTAAAGGQYFGIPKFRCRLRLPR